MITTVFGLSAALVCAAGASAQLSAGADIVYSDMTDVATYGPLNGKYAYALGSATCNIGDANAEWNLTGFNGSPGLAMNLYRIKDGRFMQIGMSFVKHSCCAGAAPGCAGNNGQTVSCNGQGGTQLGSGCRDLYSGGINGSQGGLGARSNINPWTGVFNPRSTGTGDVLFRRLQVDQNDVNAAMNPGAVYVGEGVFVSTRDAQASNRNNNASHKRIAVAANGATLTPTGSQVQGVPAIRAWRDHGLGVNTPDPSVNVAFIDVPGEGRFWYASKAKDNGNGTWRYEYAVFNLSSHISGGSLEVPVPPGVTVSNVGFYAPAYHSGEVYSNAPWTTVRTATGVRFASPETFAQNANTNALRWGTTYNFWFDAATAPAATPLPAALGLFRPSTPSSIDLLMAAPGAPACDSIDVNGDGQLPDIADIDYFIAVFAGGPCSPPPASCDVDFNNDTLTPDTLDIESLLSVFSGGPCL